MPREFEFSKTPTGKVEYAVVEDGRTLLRDRFDPKLLSQVKRTAKNLGVPVDSVYQWAESPGRYSPEPEKSGLTEVFVRRFEQTRAEGARFVTTAPADLLADLLEPHRVSLEEVLDWSDKESLCCLDVDYHGVRPPDPLWCETFVQTRLAPAPLCWHFSRGGGLHLFYVRAGEHTADELAAVAAVRWAFTDPTAKCELKSQVRGPGGAKVTWNTCQDTTGLLNRWLGTSQFDEGERDEWLAERGMDVGGRYDHDHCPIASSPDGGKHKQPVTVSEAGVFCFHCEGHGLSMGSRRPGFAPWPALLGTPSSGPIGSMVAGLCHWGHARPILLELLGLPEYLTRLAYRAALKAFHETTGKAGLVPSVFAAETDKLVRLSDQWCHADTGTEYPPRLVQSLVSAMPGVLYEDDEKKLKVNVARSALFEADKPIVEWGYPEIAVVSGYRFSRQFIPEHFAVPGVPVSRFPHTLPENVRPQYIPVSKRPAPEEYWGVLEEFFPGLDRDLIRLCLVMAGVTQETLLGSDRYLFISGVTGAAKTSHVGIASGILGVGVGKVRWEVEQPRFMQAIAEASRSSPLVQIDEIFKDCTRGRGGITPYSAVSMLFDTDNERRFHMMYHGSRPIGRRFGLILTEIDLPYELRDEGQVARRLRYYKVWRRKEWEASRAKHRITNLTALRTHSKKVAQVCDAVLSEVTDRFFAVPRPWDEMADELNAPKVEKSPYFQDDTGQLKQYFKLLCGEADETNKRVLAALSADGRGWKKLSRTESPDGTVPDVVSLYNLFADDAGAGWTTSRKLAEKDWSAVLKSDHTIQYQQKAYNGTVYARFIVGPIKKPVLVNQECFDPNQIPEG